MNLKKALKFIEQFEGCVLTAYEDQKGIWTIGFGSTGSDIKESLSWTKEQAEDRFTDDLFLLYTRISKIIDVPITDNEELALLSLSYNIGYGNFRKSRVLTKLNERNYQDAADSFLLWNRVGSQINKGLTRRRVAERKLFLTFESV